jgi:Xaa-Pro dipeptidase
MLSLTERDRRWGVLRDLMGRDGLDAIVCLGNSGAWDTLNANVRYLTGIGGNGPLASAVFPREGEVTAVVGPTPGAAYWLGVQDWVGDVRQPARLFSVMNGVAQRLRELPGSARRGRVGIAGLRDVLRHPEGVVPIGAYEMIAEALPKAELVNATPVLDDARFVKGPEEVASLERAVALAEAGIDVISEAARPGVPERAVYGRVLARLVEEGGDVPTYFSWGAAPPDQRQRNHLQPTGRPLRPGDVISVELDASVLGYRGHATQSFVLGTRSPHYDELLDRFCTVLDHTLARVVPGATPSDLHRAVTGLSTDGVGCHLVVHGRGLGEDPPLFVFRPDAGPGGERMAGWRLEEGAVVMVRPYVYLGDPLADSSVESIGWGDCVVVSAGGGRRLGRRPPGVIQIA